MNLVKSHRKKLFNDKQKKINSLEKSLSKKSLTPNAAAKHSIKDCNGWSQRDQD